MRVKYRKNEYSRSRPYVDITLLSRNGKRTITLPAIVDTGGDCTIISQSVLDLMGYTEEYAYKSVRIGNADGRVVRVPLYAAPFVIVGVDEHPITSSVMGKRADGSAFLGLSRLTLYDITLSAGKELIIEGTGGGEQWKL